jgi:hypothetical protein
VANFQQFILNLVLVSVPEEIFLTIATLILLGKHNFLYKNRLGKNALKLSSTVVVPMALISNLLKIFVKDSNVSLIVCLLIFIFLISLLCKSTGIKEYINIFVCTFKVFTMFMATEILTLLIVIYIFKLTPDYFNKTAQLNFYITIPERIIQFSYLAFYYFKLNGATQVKVFELVMENKTLKILTVVSSTVVFIILGGMLKLVIFDNILSPLSIEHQMFIILAFLSIAILFLAITWIYAVVIYAQEKGIQKYGEYDDY